MHAIQRGKQIVALFQRVLQIPCMMDAAVALRVHLECGFERDAEVVARAADRPEQFGVRILGREDNAAIGKDELAGYHVVVKEAVFAL